MTVLFALLQDLKYSLRSLRRTPGFALAAVCTLALGIGANSAIFTLLDAVMFKPLGVPHPDDLVMLYEDPTGPGAPSGTPDVTGGTGRFLRFSYPEFVRFQAALGSRGSLTAMTRSVSFAVRVDRSASQTIARGQLVAGDFFSTTGVSPAVGRPISDNDLRPGAEPVAVVSDGFANRVMGGPDAAIGRTLLVNGLPVTVIGVTPPRFAGAWTDNESHLWMPLSMQQALHYQSNASSYGPVDAEDRPWMDQGRIAWLNLFGRIRPDQRAQATATLEAANRDALIDMSLEVPPELRRSITSGHLVVDSFGRGFSGLRGRFSTALMLLAGMVAIVLLVTCANLANLLLARSTARAKEMAVRMALGASRTRLVQQGLTESLLLAFVGGALGFVAGRWASGWLATYALGTASGPLPLVFEPDARVLLFTSLTALITAFLFGLLPSWRATRLDVSQRLVGGRGAASTSFIRGMRPLVAAQLALSFVVVFAAALLGRSLINVSHINPGFALDGVVAASLNPQLSGYTTEQMPVVADRLAAAVAAVPGVRSVAISTCGLLDNCTQRSGFRILDRPGIQLNQNDVGPGYFATAGIPLKRGREFTNADTMNSALVAIVSESVARRYFGDVDPIGQQISDGESTAQIVGIAGETRPLSLREEPVPMVYFALAQQAEPFYSLAASVRGDADTQSIAIQRALKTAEPGLVIESVGPMTTYVAQSTERERLVAYLVSALGGLALLIGCIGLYGVLSYAVARRTAELGVRVALGAKPSDIRDVVLRDALQVIAAGMIAGLATAYWVNQLITSLVFEIGVFDPLTCGAAMVLLIVCAFVACALPAVRAARIDPIRALRAE
jgi:predicted permease